MVIHQVTPDRHLVMHYRHISVVVRQFGSKLAKFLKTFKDKNIVPF